MGKGDGDGDAGMPTGAMPPGVTSAGRSGESPGNTRSERGGLGAEKHMRAQPRQGGPREAPRPPPRQGEPREPPSPPALAGRTPRASLAPCSPCAHSLGQWTQQGAEDEQPSRPDQKRPLSTQPGRPPAPPATHLPMSPRAPVDGESETSSQPR